MTLPDCAKHLIRLRPSYGSRKRRYISSLAQQCEHYQPGNVHLAQQMMETMERILDHRTTAVLSTAERSSETEGL